MRFRQTFLKKWMACSLQAYFADVERLPTKQGSRAMFGSVIHAALQQYAITRDLDEALRIFTAGWDDPSVLGLGEIEVWNKYSTFGGLRQKGIDILRGYHDRTRLEQRTVIATEHKFLVPFGRHELTGAVDLLEVRKNHRGEQLLMVCDYKTGTRKPTVAELALDIQFTTYIYGTHQKEFWLGNGPEFPGVPNGEWYWETLQDMKRRGLWVHLWDNGAELDAGGRDNADFGRLYRLCEEIERAIQAQVFVPRIGEACMLCDFSSGPCPVEVPDRSWWELARIEEDASSWA